MGPREWTHPRGPVCGLATPPRSPGLRTGGFPGASRGCLFLSHRPCTCPDAAFTAALASHVPLDEPQQRPWSLSLALEASA